MAASASGTEPLLVLTVPEISGSDVDDRAAGTIAAHVRSAGARVRVVRREASDLDLQVCAETSTDRAACLDDAAACIEDIVEQSFQGFCDGQLAACAERDRSEEICAEIEAHCASGVPAVPGPTGLP